MRFKFAASVVVAAIALFALLWMVARPPDSKPVAPPAEPTVPEVANRDMPTASSDTRTRPPIAPAITRVAAHNPAARTDDVSRRIAELNALAMNNDTVSRDIILSELDNPNREIREGALEAAIQFSDRSVIPRLREVADRTQDSDEKQAILAAIDYLNLPSLTEYLEQKKALGLTNGIQTSTNAAGRAHRGSGDTEH